LSAAVFEPLSTASAGQQAAKWPWLVGALGGLIVLYALFFLLTARSLDIAVDAVGPADVQISGLVIPIGPRFLLRSGEYELTVTVPGYETYQDTISVSDAESQRLEVSPAIKPGWVTINSTPPGAEADLDGVTIGTTPLQRLSLPAGTATLTLSLPRFQQRTATIDITGRGIEQTLLFDLAPDWADIVVNANPSDATVWLEDEPLGDAGTALPVMSGERQLIIRANGYVEEVIELSVVAGVPQEIGPIDLKPSAGVLTLSSMPTGAAVAIDGVFEGRTPLEVELAPDQSHTIQLTKSGYQRGRLTLALARGESATREVTLTPRLGDVEFRLAPPEAELVINGVAMGRGDQTLALPAVEQRLEVRATGYASQRLQVTPREGLRQIVTVTLLTEAEARKAAIKPEIVTALGQTLLLIDPIASPMNEFSMGASRREPGRRSNEVLHPVKLERAFYLATTETTNAQFRQYLEGHSSGQIEGNSLNREHQPVAGVSWQQAARFCNWLSAKEGLTPFYRENEGIIRGYNASSTGYRLPSEAEWSYAARVEGEGYRKFAWGEDFPPNAPVVNVADNTSALVTGRILNGYADSHIVAAPVASFPPNHRGLYDMGGNVAEWVHDVYVIPSANAELATDPLGAMNGDNYTVRGASWALSRLAELRLTYRDYGAAGRDDLGFRIARYAE
jgi:formylglycine-generating enzyme required for sulfatase activity